MGKYTYSAIGVIFFVLPVLFFLIGALLNRFKSTDMAMAVWHNLSWKERLYHISFSLIVCTATVMFVHRTISLYGLKSLWVLIPLAMFFGYLLRLGFRYFTEGHKNES